jgi:hypothetical protein
MATIGNLFVKIGADVQPMVKSLADAQGRVAQWGKSVAGVATGVGGVIASIVPGEMGAMASRAMSGVQGLMNVFQSGSKLAAVFGDGLALLANPLGLIVLGAAAAGAAVLALGAIIVGMTLKAAKLGDRLKETADELGTSAEAFQKLEYIGTAAGAGPEAIKHSLTKMQMALASAAGGSKESGEAFKKLGLDLEKLGNMDPSAAFQAVISKIQEIPAHADKVKALRDIFGRGGAGLAGMVKLSADELAQLNKEAAAFTIREGSVQALASLQDSVDTLGVAFERLMTEAFAPFAPMIQSITDSLKEMLAINASAFYEGMTDLAKAIAFVVDGLTPTVLNLMGVYNILQAISGFIRGKLLNVFANLLDVIVSIVKALNLIPGVEIPTAGLEKSIDALKRIRDKTLEGASEDATEAGTRFSQAFAAGVANMAGQGALAKMIEDFEKQRATATAAPSGQGFKVVDQAELEKGKELETLMTKLRDDVAAIGQSEQDALRSQLEKLTKDGKVITEALALQQKIVDGKAASQRQQELTKTMDDLARRSEELGKTEMELLAIQMKRLGATDEQILQAQGMQAAMEIRQSDQKNAADLSKMLSDIYKGWANVNQSAEELLATQLRSLGATEQQIEGALSMQRDIESSAKVAKQGEEIGKILDDLRRGAEEMGMSESELLRRRLEALHATTDEINAALGSLRTKEVGSMLQELADQAKKATMSERQLLEEKLRSAGATQDEIAKGLALQDQITDAKKKDSKTGQAAGPDTIATALGSFKLQGMTNTIAVAKQQLDAAEVSNAYLASIATTNAESATMMAAAYQGGKQSTDTSLEAQSIDILKRIEINTRAFAGALS